MLGRVMRWLGLAKEESGRVVEHADGSVEFVPPGMEAEGEDVLAELAGDPGRREEFVAEIARVGLHFLVEPQPGEEGHYVTWEQEERTVVPVFSSGSAATRCLQELAEESDEIVSLGLIQVKAEALPRFGTAGVTLLMNPGLESQTEITAADLERLAATLSGRR